MASLAAPSGPPPPGAMMLGNMSKENLQALYQRYQALMKQGVTDENPEFIKLRNFFVAFHHRKLMAEKYKVAQQQGQKPQQSSPRQQYQQQQQQPEAQENGQLRQNGDVDGQSTGSMANVSNNSPDSQAPPTAPIAETTVNGGEAALAAQRDDSKSTLGAKAWSTDNVELLRKEVEVMRRLMRQKPIPPGIHNHVFGPNHSEGMSSSAKGSVAAPEDLGIAEAGPQAFIWPYEHLRQSISYAQHLSRGNRPIIPSIMPPGIDVEMAREERENVIYNRILARKMELESSPVNLVQWDTSKSVMPVEDDSLKLRALIEYKSLCLLGKQRALRQQISREMIQADNLAMTVNRAAYRKPKKQTFREARLTEKLEKQQRDARETKEKKKHIDYLKAVMAHADDVKKSAAMQRSRVQKLGRLMMVQHQTIEKEEQKRVERTAKQRLQALRENNEEAYLKLLGEAKDDRISHLLKQTDGFLKQLASSVKAQQRSAVQRYGDRNAPEAESDDEDAGEEGGKSKVDYYDVAHRIKEEVKGQSSNLVGGTLKEYQVKGLQWMISLYNNNLNGILADEMGLGKTIQTISLITYLIEKKKETGPFLVIVPLRQVTLTNWNNEFEKWAPTVNRIVYKGSPPQRKAASQQIRYGNFQVLLTTYEFIIKDRPVLSKVKWLHMIVDEGHRMKNANSKLSSTITQYYNTRYRLILTGTPLQNNLPELWALLNFVLPTIFKSVKSFDEWFNTPFANTGGQDRMELTEEEQLLIIRRLHKVLRPFLLRRLKKDVEKDLPDKQERVIKCGFSALQGKLYKQLLTHNKLTVSDGKGGKTSMRGLSNMLMQLRKLCNHPFVFDEVEEQMNPGKGSNDLLWRTAGKFELLDRILPKFQATGHRVLMFFQMTQIMNIMEDFLRLRGITYLRLDGSTKSDDRSELLKQFNAPDSPYFCFLLSTRAGGLGLNLQTADTVIIFDSDWNPHQDLQAQDRAHRIGQKNEVRILRLISSNSVEEKILEKAQYKLDMDGKVIQAGKFDNKSTNEEREAMLRVMLESADAAETNEQEEMDDDELNLVMMRADSELEVFQRMDAERMKRDKYGPGKKLPRLLSEAELPDIYVSEDAPVVDDIRDTFGRGARERTRVKYDDGLTEEQWLEAVDNDEDTIEAAVARKDAKKAQRTVNREKRLRAENGLGNSPPPSRDSSESPQPKKRGRKAKGEKRKLDEISVDGDAIAPPRKRGRQAKVMETLSPDERATLQKILNSVYDTILDLEEPSIDKSLGPRPIIDPFLDLPAKQLYPDYYLHIKAPICMNQIKKKINRNEYQNLRQFRNDIGLLCNNCRTYNEDGSMLYLDSNLIEATCLRRLKEETENHPEFQDYDGQTSSVPDERSTAPVSRVSTPMAGAAIGGRRLKINMKAHTDGGESAMQSDFE